MACVYIYGNDELAREQAYSEFSEKKKITVPGAIIASSIYEIRDKIYDVAKTKLVRYNTYTEDTYLKLLQIREKYKSYTGKHVTEICNEIVANGRKYPTDEVSDFMGKIRMKFGTGFHDIVEMMILEGKSEEKNPNHLPLEELIQSHINDIITGLKESCNEYDKMSDVYKEAAKNKGNMMLFLLKHRENNFANIGQMIKDAALEFLSNDLIKGFTLTPELPIGNEEYNILGRIDLCAYNNDGKFMIIDYKTTSVTEGLGSLQTQRSHYLQLKAYERLLAQNKVTWKYPIESYNIIFKIDPELDTFSVDLVNNLENIKGAIDRGYYDRQLDDYGFATPLNNILSVDEEKLVKDAVDVSEAVYANERLNRFSKKVFEERIKRIIVNQYQYTTQRNRKKITIQLDGNESPTADDITLDSRIKLIDESTGNKVRGYEDILTVGQFIESELAYLKQNTTHVFSQYINAFRSRNKLNLKRLLSGSENSERLVLNLLKYLNSNWVRLETPLEAFGIIAMVDSSNADDKYIEFIKISNDISGEENLNTPIKLANGELLLDDILSDEAKSKYIGYNKIPVATIGSVRLLQTILQISKFKELFPSNVKIGDIKVLSAADGSITETFNFQDTYEQALKVLQAEANKQDSTLDGKEKFIKVYDDYKSLNIIGFQERTVRKINDGLRALADEEATGIKFPDDFSGRSKEAKLKALEKLESDLQQHLERTNQFDELKKRKAPGYRPSSIGMDLYMTVGALINNVKNMPTTETMSVSKKAFTFRDSLMAGLQLLIGGEMRQYTPDGMLITGLAQGLYTSVSYTSPDENTRRVNLAIDTYAQVLRQQFIREIKEINDASIKFLEWNEKTMMFGRLLDQLLGYHTDAYMQLMQRNPDGKLNRQFRFINPYANNDLVTEQLDFLETILWHINRYRMRNLTDAVRNKTLSELKADKESFEKYKSEINSDSKWLNIPIKAGSSIRLVVQGAKDLLVGDMKIGTYFENIWDRLKESYDPKYLTKNQTDRKKRAEERLDTFNYYDEGLSRTARINKQLPSLFELNLNYLCCDYVFCAIKQKVEKDLLRTIDRQISGIILYESATGRDLSNQVEAIIDRTKVSIYNDNLIDDEYKDLATLIGIGKTIGSYTKIALRPMLYAKEILAGRIRNFTALCADFIYNGNKITFKDMMEASALVFGEGLFFEKGNKLLGNMHAGDFSLIDSINNTYAITDRDMNIYSERLSADRYGIFNTGTRNLYLNTVRPDWFNRMIIFVAKMKADGCWEAHHLNKNAKQLVYNMKEDKRFSEYYKHKNEENYQGDETFRQQKALYQAMMNDFIDAGFTNPDGTKLLIGDDLPMAYTPRERDSIKEQIGALYGYYDHEEKALGQSGTWYNLFMQFTTYLPGDIKRFFSTGKNSMVGSYVHIKDAEGNLLYVDQDPITQLDILTTEKVNKDGKELQPYTKWEGLQVEGLFISLLKTCHDLATLDFKKLHDNPQQYKNAILCLFQLLFAALIGTFLLAIMTEGTNKRKDLSLQNAILYDLVTKAANDITFYNSVVQPALGINFAGQQYFTDIIGDSFKALTNENYEAMNALYDNLSVLKDTHMLDNE